MLAADAAAVLLTQSRGAWLATAAVAAFVGLLRYRKLVLVMAGGGAAVLALGLGASFINRLVVGLQFADQAQVMRLGEFQNAATIIARYTFNRIGISR